MTIQKTIANVIVTATRATLLSWPLAISIFFLSVLLHIFASPDIEQSSIGLRSFFALVSASPMFLPIWLALRAPIKSDSLKSALVLSSFFIAGALRGYLLWFLLRQFDLVALDALASRVITSSLNFGFSFFVLSYLWNSYIGYYLSIREKAVENEKLQESLDLITKETRQQYQSMINEISFGILRTLKEIQGSSTDEQINKLNSLVEEKVRPLRASLEVESAAWEPATIQRPKLKTLERIFTLDLAASVPPPWLVIPLTFAPIFINFTEFGLIPALEVSLLSTIFVLLFSVPAFAWAKSFLRGKRQLFQIVVLNFVFLLSGVIGSIGTVIPLLDKDRPTQLLFSGVSGFFLFAWFITLSLAYRQGLIDTQNQLIGIREKLRWAIARANLANLHNRRKLSRYLHGPVQSSIQSTVISLGISSNERDKDVFDHLIERLEESKSPDWRGADFKTRFDEIELLWQGLAEIRIDYGLDVEDLLNSDPTLAAHTIELSRDLASALVRKLDVHKLHVSLEVANLNQLKATFSWASKADMYAISQATALSPAFAAASIEQTLSSDQNLHKATFLLPGIQYIRPISANFVSL